MNIRVRLFVCVYIHWYVQLKMCVSRSSPVNVVCVALARLCELLGCCQQLLGVRVGVLEKSRVRRGFGFKCFGSAD